MDRFPIITIILTIICILIGALVVEPLISNCFTANVNDVSETLYYSIAEYQFNVDNNKIFRVNNNYYSYDSKETFIEDNKYLALMSDNRTIDYTLDDFIVSIFYIENKKSTETVTTKRVQCKVVYDNIIPITVEPNYPFTEAEIEAIAKTLYGECGSMKSKMHQSAVVWCILNRVDSEDPNFPDDIIGVIEQKYQFIGYKKSNPVREDLYELAKDVLIRWYKEKNGEENVGRTLPKEYMYFHGTGKVNIFKTTYSKKNYIAWDWSLENPYES